MGGRNIYPTDIERAAPGADGVRAGNAVAVRLPGPTAAGTASRSRWRWSRGKAGGAEAEQGIRKDVTSRVVSAVGVRPAEVVVLRPGTPAQDPVGQAAPRGDPRRCWPPAADRESPPSAGERVEPVLRRLQAVAQQRLRGVRGQVDRELQLLALGAGEPLEHEVGRVLAARRAADAEPDAQVVLRARATC